MSDLQPYAAVLQRLRARPAQSPYDRCEMCAEPIADGQHSHIVNVGTRSLLCTCRACYLLFTAQEATLAYRSVPDRYLSFPTLELGSSVWDELQIPVGMAFFFRNSALGRMVGFYPSPAGATESELPLGAWDGSLGANAALGLLAPDVEALLVRRTDDGVECFLVPIDACYELVGQLRQLWRGFDGGRDAHTAVTAFFDRVKGRARPAPVPTPEAGPL